MTAAIYRKSFGIGIEEMERIPDDLVSHPRNRPFVQDCIAGIVARIRARRRCQRPGVHHRQPDEERKRQPPPTSRAGRCLRHWRRPHLRRPGIDASGPRHLHRWLDHTVAGGTRLPAARRQTVFHFAISLHGRPFAPQAARVHGKRIFRPRGDGR